MLSNKYTESYKYVHIMNIICSYLYVVVYWDTHFKLFNFVQSDISINSFVVIIVDLFSFLSKLSAFMQVKTEIG